MKFELVDDKKVYNNKTTIKVVGVGGGGGNAVNNMISAKLSGVDFIVANTDSQDLDRSACSDKIQLGPSITMGLGAGADPDIGRASAEESVNDIKAYVEGADMVFITAGMGGGTGTGASPIIARQCKECGALTVAVVTKPFKFEGDKRLKKAIEGITNLRSEVDSLIIVPNERLKALGNKSTSFKDLISRADEVLLHAVRGISDLIMSSGFINLDFADVKKVMEKMGSAIMGMGHASGENRAVEAAQMAINSPLLEDISIDSAKGLLMNITGPSNMTMEEIDAASNYIKDSVNDDAEIFWGVVFDDDTENELRVTVIATGINNNYGIPTLSRDKRQHTRSGELTSNVVSLKKVRDLTPDEQEEQWVVKKQDGEVIDELDIPTFQRKGTEPLISQNQEGLSKKKKGLFGKLNLNLKDSLDYPTFLRLKAD
ncbi:GTP-binding tubulin-like cell division protein [uncultured Desulfobacterium sp.]|uniref:Cell division protein FtsZ n=1 Tax=uncultured Desulfobacterium sp. TaxID=201089 RepID=A0A445MVT0_9BACT|nr:GTP-binding tubulin-like cell division protein [uncultured Desulfobacterium sp.]